MLGLHCCKGFSLVAASGGYSLVAARGLFIAGASLVAEHRLQSTGSVVVAHEFSCCEARGIFGDQGLNPCLLPWQADSSPLSRQRGPAHPFSVLKTDTGLTQKSARWVEIRGVKSSC